MPIRTNNAVSGLSPREPQALGGGNPGAHANNLRYELLNIETHEIRLLRIRPADDAVSPIECSLETVSLLHGTFPPYCALSYEWSPNVVVGRIQISVNNFQVRVTINLASAPLRLRQRIAALSIWINAICINQTDDRERDSQVTLMVDIYRSAFTTWAYLGHNHDNGTLAIEFLVEAGENLLEGELSSDWSQAKLSDERSTPAVVALRKLCERPYWRRNWIVQELAVANRPRLLCGSGLASLEHLEGLIQALVTLNLQPNTRFQLPDADTDLLASRSGYRRYQRHGSDIIKLVSCKLICSTCLNAACTMPPQTLATRFIV